MLTTQREGQLRLGFFPVSGIRHLGLPTILTSPSYWELKLTRTGSTSRRLPPRRVPRYDSLPTFTVIRLETKLPAQQLRTTTGTISGGTGSTVVRRSTILQVLIIKASTATTTTENHPASTRSRTVS